MAKRRAQKQIVPTKELVRAYLKKHPNVQSKNIAKALKLTPQQVYSARNQLKGENMPSERKKEEKDPVTITVNLKGKVLTFEAETVTITSGELRAKFN